jgi:hypothetical protein
MNFLKNNKVAIGGGIALALVVYIYFSYFSGGSSASLTASDSGTPLSSNILITLQSVNSIKLDNSIFTDPVFVSLSDFGVSIPSQNVGRRNPFAPLGAASRTTGTTSVKH